MKRGREIERSLPRLSKAAGSEPFVCACRMRELWGSQGREDMEKVLPQVDSSAWECCKCQVLHSSFLLFSLLHFKIIFRIHEQCIFLVFFSFLPIPSRSFPPPYPPPNFIYFLSKRNNSKTPQKKKKVKKEKSNLPNLNNNEGTRKTWSPCCTAH